MTVTNSQSGTNVHEIASGIYRISTPVPPSVIPGGFTFNQYLLVATTHRCSSTPVPGRCSRWVRDAVAHVLGDVSRLRYVGFSHIESDECGSMNELLAAAPRAEVVCSRVAAMTSADLADRPPRALADGEELSLGRKRVRWLDAPHLPHNWECGYLFESSTRTLLCGDVFTHGGSDLPALTESEVIGPAEATRLAMPDGRGHRRQHPAAAGEARRNRTDHAGGDARQRLQGRRTWTAAWPCRCSRGLGHGPPGTVRGRWPRTTPSSFATSATRARGPGRPSSLSVVATAHERSSTGDATSATPTRPGSWRSRCLLALLLAVRQRRVAEPEHLDRFVLGTCRNVAARMREHAARAAPTELAELDVAMEVPEPETVDLRALTRCLASIDARARVVVHLSFHEERSAEEIAQRLGTTAGNVRLLRHRAVARLRRCLDGRAEESR